MASASLVADKNNALGGVGDSSSRVCYLLLGLLAVLTIALAAPLYSLARWMLGNDYYQHFPLLVIAAFGLGFYRWWSQPTEYVAVFSPRVLFWICCSIALTVAVFVLPSRWSASIALLSIIATAVNFIGGRLLAALLFGPWLLLWAAIPMPVHFDNWFVVILQQLATWLASVWLELVGVMHLTTGVGIQTPGQDYFVKDACSGIHSVFAAIAVGVGYGVMRRYCMPRLLLVLAQLLVWVVIANALRVFLTVYGESAWGLDLSNPTYHETLGMVTFACGIMLALSGDHFLRYLRPVDGGEAQPPVTKAGRASKDQLRWLDKSLSIRFAALAVIGMAIVGFGVGGLYFNYRWAQGSKSSLEELARTSLVDFGAVQASFVPAEIGEWRQTGFQVDKRGKESVFGGLVSFVWQYSNGSRQILISLDGPYEDWHDLAVCYTGVGWAVSEMQAIESTVRGKRLRACELNLERRPLDHAHVLYVCFNQSAGDIPPAPFAGMAFRQMIHRFRLGMVDREQTDGGVVQMQLYCEQPGRLTSEQQAENQELFWKAVEAAFGKQIAERDL